MSVLFSKFKEVLASVLPITLIVVILHFTVTPLETPVFLRFLFGALLIIVGMTIFLLGVDVGITPIGNTMGSSIARSNKLWIVVIAGLLLGFMISVAEPDLHILAGQVSAVTAGLLSKNIFVIVVSLGIAVMVAVGLVRIVYNFPLYKLLLGVYTVIFGLALFVSPEFLAISFDASGATTGALTVPFILALAMGVSRLKKDSKSSEKDSFGLVAIASAGAIIAVMLMSVLSKGDRLTGSLPVAEAYAGSILGPFLTKLPVITLEVFVALLPILLLFLILQKVKFRMSVNAVRKILFGMLFTFVGLVLFLLGVNAGFMEVGSVVSYELALLNRRGLVIGVAFLLGLVTILAEPAVYVLTHQIEEVTSGYVQRKVVMITLAIGVASAVALSVVRILVPGLQLWHFLLPGYLLSLGLMFVVPKLFIGIAFDSGGVASGPMTATFVLAFAQGVAEATEGAAVLVDGFGIIAMVAMTPLIALQLLGLVFKMKSKKGGVEKIGA
ncbi:DUF1538 domain-containing protein [Proteiniclasticum sp. BAD-10]|uniref:DUF1538 domain-containing protein n=1 Tax=Proteiniclasticum sediminis TaxID=2804028 RepID=A0A941CS27_9CLOT|nr:DUF1538 domain-containing protein [Proteiniclasticum sediminis]MBR0577089.1 DUF1538 domain-containing protein [Proteiniclasticum sediminis]